MVEELLGSDLGGRLPWLPPSPRPWSQPLPTWSRAFPYPADVWLRGTAVLPLGFQPGPCKSPAAMYVRACLCVLSRRALPSRGTIVGAQDVEQTERGCPRRCPGERAPPTPAAAPAPAQPRRASSHPVGLQNHSLETTQLCSVCPESLFLIPSRPPSRTFMCSLCKSRQA